MGLAELDDFDLRFLMRLLSWSQLGLWSSGGPPGAEGPISVMFPPRLLIGGLSSSPGGPVHRLLECPCDTAADSSRQVVLDSKAETILSFMT